VCTQEVSRCATPKGGDAHVVGGRCRRALVHPLLSSSFSSTTGGGFAEKKSGDRPAKRRLAQLVLQRYQQKESCAACCTRLNSGLVRTERQRP
jgi:hypothetical protein